MRAVGFPAVFALVLAAFVCAPARAAFHLYSIAEFFSSADGSVQFIRLHSDFGSQNFVAGVTITCFDGSTTHTFTFPSNLVGNTANTDVLIATANFGSLPGGVAPDFVIPAGFIFVGGGTLTFAPGAVASVVYGALPTNGQLSVNAAGQTAVNTPANFARRSGSVNVPPGSCCVGAACSVTVEVSCSGAWTDGGMCEPDPCGPPPAGVCCIGATCRVSTGANCVGASTVFVSAGACNAPGDHVQPCCHADFNHINGLTVQDIFEFLNAWFAGDLGADIDGNGSGPLTVQSIFSFLNVWFAGC
ncbi:MAG TPA: GC-type dockerin domain-anchored protein [Phycisphaerales bacterium]|nr:GC-type dockerin domain-anchored protein [Phycisphaerales bacterium]